LRQRCRLDPHYISRFTAGIKSGWPKADVWKATQRDRQALFGFCANLK
jgi:hypothetical protein